MSNAEIAQQLGMFADLLEIKGESPFRVSAYRRASEAIGDLNDSLETLAAHGELTGIPGIGAGIAAAIGELIRSGHYAPLEDLLDEVPATLLTMLEISGVGSKTVGRLYRELGITDIVQLEAAASAGRIRSLKGFGPRHEQKILQGIAFLNQRTHRCSIGMAYPLSQALVHALRSALSVEVETVGSVRRMCETVGNIDLIAATQDLQQIRCAAANMPGTSELEREGGVIVGQIEPGVPIRIAAVDPAIWGTELVRWTGSSDHMARLATLNGGNLPAALSEAEVYRAAGLPWMPPELRENPADLEAALVGSVPSLIQTVDIRGDLHLHSNWSDGHATILEMAEAARERGYAYLSISDHSGSLGIAHGLDIDRLRKQRREIDRVNELVPEVRLFRSCEIEVRRDGTLDYPDEVLAELDIVVASLHSGLNQPPEELTKRIIKVITNPHVDIVAHPTGRIIERRPEAVYDWEQVFHAARETGTALEINANPARLDLKDTLARAANQAGVTIVIDSDAHDVASLGLMHFGVAVARRARIEAGSVLNTRSLPALIEWLGR